MGRNVAADEPAVDQHTAVTNGDTLRYGHARRHMRVIAGGKTGELKQKQAVKWWLRVDLNHRPQHYESHSEPREVYYSVTYTLLPRANVTGSD